MRMILGRRGAAEAVNAGADGSESARQGAAKDASSSGNSEGSKGRNRNAFMTAGNLRNRWGGVQGKSRRGINREWTPIDANEEGLAAKRRKNRKKVEEM